MSYELTKPCTEKQRMDFIAKYNHQQGLKIEETATAIYALEANEIMVDGKPQVDPDYDAKQAQAEAERIAKLTMTSLDFINFLEESGLTLEEITAWLDMPENLRVKTQLTYCQNVYCGVACALMPIKLGDVEITENMVIEAFKVKYEG